MPANPVKGELEVATASGAFTFCYPWGVQTAVTKTLGGKQFLPAIGRAMADLSDDDLAYLFRMGLQHAHPAITEGQVEAILSEIGPGRALRIINESVALAYDLPMEEGAPDPSPEPPPATAARDGTRGPASASGSASESDLPTTSGA